MPNETWQSDFTHYRLTRPDGRPGADTEIISWLDDCTRYALHVTAHPRITTPIVQAHLPRSRRSARHPSLDADRQRHGLHRPTGRPRPPGGRNGFEQRTPRLARRPEELPTQPPHHLREGRALPADDEEVAARPTRPALDHPRAPGPPRPLPPTEYNHHRPHRSLPHRATPATLYNTDAQGPARAEPTDPDTHDRIRHDRVDKSGTVTLRIAGQLRHIGIGRTHAGTHVILLVQDLDDPRRQRRHRRTPPRPHHRPQTRDYQPRDPGNEEHPNPRSVGPGVADVLRHHTGGGGGI